MSMSFPEGVHQERRRFAASETVSRTPSATLRDHLQRLPALILLNRLSIPTLAVGSDGEVVYANPAFAAMLGYPDATAVTEWSLPSLMAGQSDGSARSCVAALRGGAGSVADWWHVDGYRLHAVVSNALLTRATDPVLLITLTDVTDLLWSTRA